jgi:hypothetical protein
MPLKWDDLHTRVISKPVHEVIGALLGELGHAFLITEDVSVVKDNPVLNVHRISW